MIKHSKPHLTKIILIILAFSLLLGLTPFSDTDLDGVLESVLTETDLMIPILERIAMSIVMLALLDRIRPTSRPSISYLLIPPPIN
jgi:hypothetical protein